MKKMNTLLLMLLSIGGGATPSFADDIYLGMPTYGGSGCPERTLGAALSPDRKTVSILFDAYQSEAGRPTGKTSDRKSCNFAVPVHIPQGISISVYKVDYRGFNNLPRGGNSIFQAEYFFAGGRGPSSRRTFNGPLQSNFTFTDRLGGTVVVWSPCGADTNLRANTNLIVNTNSAQEQTVASIDSADIQGGIVYHLQWRRCTANENENTASSFSLDQLTG